LLFGRLLDTYSRAPDSSREELYRRIHGLHVPSDKSALERVRREWIESRCRAIAAECGVESTRLDSRLRSLVSAASACSALHPSPIAAAAEALGRAVATAPATATDDRVTRLIALAAVAPESAGVRSALESARQEERNETLRVANDCRPAEAERCLVARCSQDSSPDTAPLSERQQSQVDRAIQQRVRDGVASLLDGLVSQNFSEASILAPFGARRETLPVALIDRPRGWRIEDVRRGQCGDRAEVTLLRRGSRRAPAQHESLSMCHHLTSSRWFVCSNQAGAGQ
jgi:hypothetical protein